MVNRNNWSTGWLRFKSGRGKWAGWLSSGDPAYWSMVRLLLLWWLTARVFFISRKYRWHSCATQPNKLALIYRGFAQLHANMLLSPELLLCPSPRVYVVRSLEIPGLSDLLGTFSWLWVRGHWRIAVSLITRQLHTNCECALMTSSPCSSINLGWRAKRGCDPYESLIVTHHQRLGWGHRGHLITTGEYFQLNVQIMSPPPFADLAEWPVPWPISFVYGRS